MSADSSDEDDLEIPLFYRLVLKFPRLTLDGFSDRIQGLFWALILPLFVFCDVIINLLLIGFLPFPFNLLSMILFTSVILMLILRVLIERELNIRKAIVKDTRFRWDVETSFQEYAELLQKRRREKEAKKQN
ncbi:MAG: hypothetical protein ABSC91_10525 [Candidatus Bathyarchaeia archaeon]|jgi:hypothetical protein